MKNVVGRILSAVMMAAGWVITGVRTVLDFIGYATAPEDSQVAGSLVRSFLLWVMDLPIWLPWGFALVATMWLMYVSWPKHGNLSLSPNEQLSNTTKNDQTLKTSILTDAEKEEIYDGPHEILRQFVNDNIIPCINLLSSMQDKMIMRYVSNSYLEKFIDTNLSQNHKIFTLESSLEDLKGLSTSPMEFIYFDDMVKSVDTIEKNYRFFAEQANEIASALGVILKSDPELSEMWTRWREEHDRMVRAYEPIKNNSRMKTSDGSCSLFRPARFRKSRWGELAPISDANTEFQFLLPLGTEEGTQQRSHPG